MKGRATSKPSTPSEPKPEDPLDPLVLQNVDKDPSIDALIFEESTAPMAERAAEQAALYVGAAVLFGIGVWVTMGSQAGSEYFAGYLLEQSLSVDNLFVFILVFKYFKTPVDAQRKALFWGILTAAVLRLVMILLGVELIQLFEPLLLLFAGILLFSCYKLLFAGDDDEDSDLSDNFVVKLCRRFIKVTDHYDADNFLTYENGVRMFTPLVLVMAVIEISDVIFAVDSIPAVFGITLNPFIIYSSNIFAIVSLRAFYSFIAVFMEKLRFLDKSVALVLGFIGLKMVLDFFDMHMPTWVALLVVAGTLTTGVAASLLLPGAPEEHASVSDDEGGSPSSTLTDGDDASERGGLLSSADASKRKGKWHP